jgi:hypothetical protein
MIRVIAGHTALAPLKMAFAPSAKQNCGSSSGIQRFNASNVNLKSSSASCEQTAMQVG